MRGKVGGSSRVRAGARHPRMIVSFDGRRIGNGIAYLASSQGSVALLQAGRIIHLIFARVGNPLHYVGEGVPCRVCGSFTVVHLILRSSECAGTGLHIIAIYIFAIRRENMVYACVPWHTGRVTRCPSVCVRRRAQCRVPSPIIGSTHVHMYCKALRAGWVE